MCMNLLLIIMLESLSLFQLKKLESLYISKKLIHYTKIAFLADYIFHKTKIKLFRFRADIKHRYKQNYNKFNRLRVKQTALFSPRKLSLHSTERP
jgi:hypothetical protein